MSNILKAKEVAELLRLSEATVFKLLAQGKLPGFRIGVSWRVDRDELMKFIEEARIVAQPKPRKPGQDSSKRHDRARLTREAPFTMERNVST